MMSESKPDVQCRTLVLTSLPYSWHEEGRGGPLNNMVLMEDQEC